MLDDASRAARRDNDWRALRRVAGRYLRRVPDCGDPKHETRHLEMRESADSLSQAPMAQRALHRWGVRPGQRRVEGAPACPRGHAR